MISAIVLAAGKSERMGRPKLAMRFEGDPILRVVVDKLFRGGCDEVRVVLGHHAEVLLPLLAGTRAEASFNPTPEGGMLSSVKIGLAALPDTADTVVIHPADIPGFLPETLWSLLTAFRSLPADAMVPEHEGRRGHPLLLRRALARAVVAMPEDAKLSDLLRSEGVLVEALNVDDPGVLKDIDRPEDLAER